MHPSPSARRRAISPWLAVVAILLLAANLRLAVNALGVVLPELRAETAMGGAAAGLLTALPPFCFGLLGLAGPSLARRLGLERTTLLALLILTGGQLVRALIPGLFWVFAGSILALAAIALANVVLPSLVRQYFPGSIAAMTTAYTVTLAAAAAGVSFVTVPLLNMLDADWRLGLGLWAVVAAIAIVPWLPMARHRSTAVDADTEKLPLRTIARVPRAWALAAFFGLQSFGAYVVFGWFPTLLQDLGLSAASANAQVGVISLSATIATLAVPTLLSRLARPALLIWVLVACYVLGYAGLLLWPMTATALWSILLGIGHTLFPVALYAVNLRARTHGGVLSLSGFMQSVGYMLAGTTLFLMGTLHGDSDDWMGVLWLLIAVCLFMHIAALISVSGWTIEEELERRGLRPERNEDAIR